MMLPPDRCPRPQDHGAPFKYCPLCSWTSEEQRTEFSKKDLLAAFEAGYHATPVHMSEFLDLFEAWLLAYCRSSKGEHHEGHLVLRGYGGLE